MNCKKDDLAIVVKSAAGNEGAIVKCVKFNGYFSWVNSDGSTSVEPTWQIDRTLQTWDGGLSDEMPDDQLRPIRDPGDDAIDETLLRLPAPSKERMPA